MRKYIFVILLGIATPLIFAQKSEVGFFLGTSFYMGDLNPMKPFAKSQMAGGLIYRYNINKRFAVRANLLFGSVKANDAETNKNYSRNLSFQSSITEISAVFEINFIELENSGNKRFFSPYIFGGFAVFNYNPKADYNGVLYSLQPLGTEGQGLEGMPKKYALTNIAIPFGLGIKFNFLKYFCIAAEWGMRYTFTDYIDDVSTVYYGYEQIADKRSFLVAELSDRSEIKHELGSGRGNPKTKDWYSYAGVTFSFKFGNINRCTANESKSLYVKRSNKR